MERLNNIHIYNTAYRRFDFGSVAFDSMIRSVSRQEPSVSGEGRYLIPGLVDIHMHIESSMATPAGFSEYAIQHGTTAVVSDSHEISNVFSVKGLEDFMSIPSLCDIFWAIPSSVPASGPELETSGGSFDREETAHLAKDKRIVALGEVMNASDLLASDDNRTKRIIKAFSEARPECPVEGHCPRLSGAELAAFIASGVDSDHTEQTPQSIAEKLSAGMFLEIQYKSLSKENIEALSCPEVQGMFSFCTDDVMPDVLVSEGHLDRVVRKAIALGMRAEDAVFAATYSPCRRMNLRKRGMIAPGCIADFIILSDLDSFEIESVWKSGVKVYEKGNGLLVDVPEYSVPGYAADSIKRKPVSASDFSFPESGGDEHVIAIEHFANTTMTGRKEMALDLSRPLPPGVNIVASVERYGHENPVKPVILYGGFTKRGAVASSWAHDSHNILVMATDPEMAAKAVNAVISMKGGIAAADDSTLIEVPLGYAGIVSLESMDRLAEHIADVRSFMKEHGYEAREEIMSFAVLALPVSPVLKVTDKGLVDVKAHKIIDFRSRI